MGFPSLGGVNACMLTGSFSAILQESKPSLMGLPLLGVPHSAVGIFPSQSTRLMFCLCNCPNSEHKHYPMGSHHLNLRVDHPPRQFSSVGFLPNFDAGNTPARELPWHSGDSSVVGFLLHGGQLHCWVYSHSEVSDRHNR